jgi:hypothetical protein
MIGAVCTERTPGRPASGPVRAAFAAGLNDVLYVTGAVALAGAVCALLLIRRKDFVRREEPQAAPAGDGQAMRVAGTPVRSAQE